MYIDVCIYVCVCLYTHIHIYHIMEYYLAIRNEILQFVATQMDLKDIKLSEISQAKKNKHHMILLICGL